jgi:hypothetical protein
LIEDENVGLREIALAAYKAGQAAEPICTCEPSGEFEKKWNPECPAHGVKAQRAVFGEPPCWCHKDEYNVAHLHPQCPRHMQTRLE